MPAVEQCPFREQVRVTDDGRETAICRLVSAIVGDTDSPTNTEQFPPVIVSREACQACTRADAPSTKQLNPVVASFLYTQATEIIQRGGIPGCGSDRAEELQQWALKSIQIESAGRHHRVKKRSFRDCIHLGEILGFRSQNSTTGLIQTPVFRCGHPNHQRTTESECVKCHDWCADENLRPQRLCDLLPRPESWGGGLESAARRQIRWAVGMTTAPRRRPTLEISLDHLRRAGWDDVYLAVDGGTSLRPTAAVESIAYRSPIVGAWPNYFLTLSEMILRNPDADAILLLQDDVQIYDRENIRAYLESILWPRESPSLISLYCSTAYTKHDPGWSIAEEIWGWGALAFIFPIELAKQFVCDPDVVAHRWTNQGDRYIDDVIGGWAERHSIPIWYPTPSLTQHIGETSTVWTGAPALGYRRADRFVGEAVESDSNSSSSSASTR